MYVVSTLTVISFREKDFEDSHLVLFPRRYNKSQNSNNQGAR